MVAKRMGSQGGVTNNNGGAQTLTQGPKSNPLARQGSWYSLTLDEVQNQLGDLGKSLTSMNLDELLKTVFSSDCSNHNLDSGPVSQQTDSTFNGQSGLTLSRDLSKKTVDEVWKNIQEEQRRSSLDRKATLGEMTLEDFLVKAGVVAESCVGKKHVGLALEGVDPMNVPQAQWMNFQIPSVNSQHQLPVFMPGHPVQQPVPISGNPVLDGGHSEAQMMGNSSDTQTPGRKRVAPDDIVEKSVERRQKRMIKNRESAARSRARKQAYTHELENKVSRLEEENERLKRQKEWDKVLPSIPQQQPKYQLRRTSSAPVRR